MRIDTDAARECVFLDDSFVTHRQRRSRKKIPTRAAGFLQLDKLDTAVAVRVKLSDLEARRFARRDACDRQQRQADIACNDDSSVHNLPLTHVHHDRLPTLPSGHKSTHRYYPGGEPASSLRSPAR